MVRRVVALGAVCLLSLIAVRPAVADTNPDIVLRTPAFINIHGNWTIGPSTGAADDQSIASTDSGWSQTASPLAQPTDYFEAKFDAPAGTPYHVWVRLRATDDSKYNDSVWLQYSDATTSGGAAVYRIGTASGLDVNLERCGGCGSSGWGWQDGAYWLSQTTTVRFASSGSHTLRVQTREDGVEIDQIVLSPVTYLFKSPGSMADDSVIVPMPEVTADATATAAGATLAASTTAATSVTATAAGAYLGSAVSLPGRVEAENFDTGADSVSYHDSTAGNAGGAYRQTNVDIQTCNEGGYNLGWIVAGEWLNYTVNVKAAGAYTVKLRVSSLAGGGALHVGFNKASNVWKSVAIPKTGGWQTWTTVSVPVTLGAGEQQITILVDHAGFNFNHLEVASGTTASTPTTGGSTVKAVTWNIKINDSSASHAQKAMDYIAAMSPTPAIVVIQEGRQSLFNTYISQLQSRTGKTWKGVFRTHCPNGGWNGSSCTSSEDEGVGVFTSLPVVNSSTTFLPYSDGWHSARGVARMAVSVNGVVVQVFSTHLQSTVSARASAITRLKSYAAGYSAPQIIGGDLNADRDEIVPKTAPNFVDTWGQVGSGNGYTCSTPSPTMKLDYWLTDAGGRATANSSVVQTSPGTFSDHYAIVNTFTIK